MNITHTEDYRALREKEYPPIADFIDAMYWQSRGDVSKMTIYVAKCDLVKAKYPKTVEE